jgi:putative ABC transport system permease protein
MRVRLNVVRLQDFLANSPLSQNHWAARLGFSRGHWSDLVNGRHPYPSPKTRLRIVEVLGVRTEDFFSIESGPTTWHDTDFRSALKERYLIDRELGQGAMGAVYLALDVARGRTVAVKVLAPEAVCGIGQAAFLREISTLSRLQHPNILPLFDSGVVAEHPFFVMPWVRGGSLRDRLVRDTRLALPDVIAVTRGIAAGLHHAHGEFVLHCDVKPENILLHDDHAWLVDFGISRILHAEASEWRARKGIDVSAGTPAYVSPEQALGDEDIDGRADVYSLGCVVYEMLAGRPPFEGTTTETVVARRFVAPAPPVTDYAPELPAAVNDVLMRAMQLDRDRRPDSPVAFVAELVDASRGMHAFRARVSLPVTRAVGAMRRRAGRPAANRFGGNVVHLVQDARLTLRTLRRDWRFALAFVVPLALGLGAGASFYSIIDHVLYRPPPHVTDADGLLRFAIASERWPDPFKAGATGVSWVDYDAIRRHAATVSNIAAFITFPTSLGRGEGARRVSAMLATHSYFDVLGVRPQRGRFFTAEEDREPAALVPCVVSDGFFRVDLGSAPEAIGRTLTVGEIRCTVIGVTPPGFNGTGISPIDVYLPVRAAGEASHGDAQLWNTDMSSWIRLIGRSRPGVSAAAINLDITRAYQTFTTRRRDPQMKNSMVAVPALGPATQGASTRLRTARWLVGGAAALLLLVAANLINLLIARNLGRQRETAVRLALGGSRGRLFTHYLLECVVLALLAGAGALLVVNWVGPVARTVLYPGTPWADGPVTIRIVTLAMGLSLVVGAVIAAITALQATRVDPAALLTAGGGARTTVSRASHRARLGLVGVQAALSMALLVASAGFVRSFNNAASTALGFDMDGLIFADVPNLSAVDSTRAGQVAFFNELRDRLAAVPGVASVSLGYNTPWYFNRNETLRIPGRDSLPQVPNFGEPAFDAVTPEYLTTMRLRLRAGRWMEPGDNVGAPPVMVVSASMAQLYWSNEREALGACVFVGPDSPTCRQVIGVVDDIRFTGGLSSELVPSYYLPLSQAIEYSGPPKLFIRAKGDPTELMPVIRRLVQGARPDLPAADVHMLQTHLDPLLSSWRLGAMSFSALGLLAALIAMLGLFSVIAYLVAERRKEFAIRSALGARRAQIMTPVIRQSVSVVTLGALSGLLVAWRAAPWIQPQLFQVRLLDPAVVVVVVVGLLGVAIVAVTGPARKAATLDPIEALRAE